MNSREKTPSRLLLTVVIATSAMLLGIIGAVAAGTGTVTPPPKIAFVASNVTGSPDALTVGPMAGRLGAPLFITNGDTLGESTKNALVAYGADLIIVAGGPNTVSDGVLDQIADATGKDISDIADTPSDGIVRVAGSGRDQTAVALADLIAAYNPNFLPTNATAADSDLLDGMDSAGFLSWPAVTRADSIAIHSAWTGNAELLNYSGQDYVRPLANNTTFVLMSPNRPPTPVGTSLQINKITICYRVVNAADSITSVGVLRQDSSVDSESVSLSSTTRTCADVAGPFDGSAIEIQIQYSFGGTGAFRELQIYYVELEWDIA